MYHPEFGLDMFVIGIIGSKGAGKDTLAEHLSKVFRAGHHSHSEIYHDILKILKLPESRMNLIRLVELRKVFGENVLINALNKKLKENKKEIQIVTGIRFQNELDNVRTFEKNFAIYIDAPIEKRFERMKQRGKYNDDSAGYDEFVKVESAETEIHIPELGKQADFKLSNDDDLQSMYTKAEEAINSYLEKNGK
jgi:dephospho-CoA kinase